jgi:hypothetical protein
MGWQPLLLLPGRQQRLSTATLAMQLPWSLGKSGQQQQQQRLQQIADVVESDVLLLQLLVADVGGLLSRIGSSKLLAAVLDCWPAAAAAAAAVGDSAGEEAAWQQALHAGSKWWQHLLQLAGVSMGQQQQQQQSNVIEGLDLAVPPTGLITGSRTGNSKMSATAAASSSASDTSGQQQQQQHLLAAAAAGGLSPASFMSNLGLLRSLLDHSRQQQHVRERQCLLQQLRRDHGWVWGCVERAEPAAAATGGQRQLLPAAVAEAVVGRWWAGPVMRGSALEGSVLDQQTVG